MSGAPKVRSMNVGEPEARAVLVPAGNKARLVPTAPKSPLKPMKKVERAVVGAVQDKNAFIPIAESPPSLSPSFSGRAVLRRHGQLIRSNLPLNASCSSDASMDSFCSRASTGRIGRPNAKRREKLSISKPEKISLKPERVVPDGIVMSNTELLKGKRRCTWVTPRTDPCYVTFHDEEWGVPVHDDKKLFELLVLSGALAELTWPAILSKRQIFRDVFMDFDPLLVSKLNEKKILVPGSTASSLLSEPKLRAIIENAHQVLKIIEEFGSFDRYCWSFVNHKPNVSRFRYPRQVPVKTPKADVISKDLMRRGFRSVGPTVIYSFMQASGMTMDHLVSCYRFDECATTTLSANLDEKKIQKSHYEAEEMLGPSKENGSIDLELSRAVDSLNIS